MPGTKILRAELRRRRIGIRLARPGIEPPNRLGRHRWVIDRSMSWLMRYRELGDQQVPVAR